MQDSSKLKRDARTLGESYLKLSMSVKNLGSNLTKSLNKVRKNLKRMNSSLKLSCTISKSNA